MTNLKKYVSAAVTYVDMIDIDKPGVIIALYGPRGGTVCTAELSLDEARNLHNQLTKALTETKE
jgi:hypothetical protein